jgi:hypothetical protein
MRLPLIGQLDLKSMILGAVFVYFVLPMLMGLLNRNKTA